MITRRIFGGLLLGGMALVVSGCADINPYRYRFKMTVEVETPAGFRSGLSVYEVWANWARPGSKRRAWGEKGEAVAIDPPDGRVLFALLKTGAIHGDMASLSMATLDKSFNNTMVESAQKLSRRGMDVAGVVRPENYPLLVTFKDIKDPTSVERVDPDNLEASFGKGYRLKAITVQVTDEEVTTGIEKRLPWLGKLEKYRTDKNNPFTSTLPSEIGGLRSK